MAKKPIRHRATRSKNASRELLRRQLITPEKLEHRQMLAADLGDSSVLPEVLQAAPQVKNLLFVDEGLKDYQQLARDAQGDDILVVTLDTSTDPVLQMTEVISRYVGIESVQLASHGNENGLQIGSHVLDAEAVDSYRDQLASWQVYLSHGADILLYGCDIAAGENALLVHRIASLTGADVAASTDLTGASELGGDWDLEYATGAIQANAALNAETTAFPGLLFKPYTHVAVAKAARDDLLDGSITIVSADNTSVDVAVNPIVRDAIANHPKFYYAGTIGPDGFPDFIMGQGVMHPINNGLWLKHILEQAWAAQTDSNANNGYNRQDGETGGYTAAEKEQILAYAYGVITHSAGDIWAHTIVNDVAEGIFPDVIGDPSEEHLHIAISHILVENYIGDATPGFDGNGTEANHVKIFDGSVLTDVIIDQTPAVELPTNAEFDGTSGGLRRFIYETQVLPQPPSAGLSNSRGVAIDTIVDMRDGLQTKLNDLFADGVTIEDINIVHNRFAGTRASFDSARENFQEAGRKLADAYDTLTTLENTKEAAEDTKAQIEAVLEDEKCDFDGSFLSKVANAFRCGAAVIGEGLSGALDIAAGFAQDVVNSANQAVQAAASAVLGAKDAVQGAATGFGNALALLVTDQKALRAAYLDAWVDDIDDGLANWPELGLRITRGLFDPETKRQVQDEICEGEVNNARILCEAGVGQTDVMLSVVDTPPGFDTSSDPDGVLDGTSFVDDHLLKMFTPDIVGDIRATVREIGGVLDDIDLFDGILDFVTQPLEAAGEKIQDKVQEFVVDQVSDAVGVDLDVLGSLVHSPSSKLSLERIGCPEIVNGQPIEDTACAGLIGGLPGIDLFDPEDREYLDRAMGLMTSPTDDGSQLHVPFDAFEDGKLAGKVVGALPTDPFFQFHENKVGGFLDSVEFIPRSVGGSTSAAIFPVFENAVTITKLSFLDGPGMDQFVNAQLQKELGANQHFDLYTDLGVMGNVMITTLPELPMPPGAVSSNFLPNQDPHEFEVEPGDPIPAPGEQINAPDPTNQEQWLRSIDGDHPWQSGREPVEAFVDENGETVYASAGAGNFPLFEIGTLREHVFREIFLDWENDLRDNNTLDGSSVFPDHTDTPRDDQSLVVTTKDDIVDWYDGENSLREAIIYANSGDVDHDGNDHDTITFATDLDFNPKSRKRSLSFAQDTLDPVLGELLITEDLTIDASMLGRKFTIDANFRSRAINANSGDLTLNNLHIIGGQTSQPNEPGAGIRVPFGSLTLIDSEVVESRTLGTNSPGTGIYVSGSVTLTGSAVIDSLAAGDNSPGGGIYSPSSITITNSTLSGNRTTGVNSPGGGVSSPSPLTIINSTISDNRTAKSSSPGGGIDAVDLVLGSVAVTGNSTNGAIGGGINAATAKISNGVIVGNAANGRPTSEFEISPTTALSFFGGNLVGQSVSGSPTFNAAAISNVANATNVNELFQEVVTTRFDSNGDGVANSLVTGVLTGVLQNNGGSTETLQLFNVTSNEAIDQNPPVSLFRFEGDAADSFGGNNGTFNGGLTATAPGAPDVSATAIEFDGDASKFVQLANPLTVGDKSHTIEMWLKVPTVGTGNLTSGERVGEILGSFGSNPNANWGILADGQVQIFWNNGQVRLRGTEDLRDNQWHHLTFVRDKTNNEFRAYIDGQLEPLTGPGGTSNFAGTDITFTTPHRIGQDNRGSTTPPLHGSLDELAIHERALSAEEILVRAGKFDQRGLPRIISDAGLAPPVMDLGPLEFQERLLEVKSHHVNIFEDIVDPYDDVTSLREAINFANEDSAVDTITFDSSVFDDGDVLLLNGRELAVTESIIIDGAVDTTGRVTLDAGLRSRIINFDAGPPNVPGDLTLSNLILTNGNATEFAFEGGGGAVRSRRIGTISLVNTDVTNSSTLGDYGRGGGIYSNGSIALTGSTIRGNQTEGNSAQGGGLFAKTDITVVNSTISGNRTFGDLASGGGIASYSSTGNVILYNSSVVGNAVSSFASGGGLGGANLTITNSTVTGNTAGFVTDPDSNIVRLNPVDAPINLTLPTATGNEASQPYILSGKENGVTIFAQPGDTLTLIDPFPGGTDTIVPSFDLGALEIGTIVTAQNDKAGNWNLLVFGTRFVGGGGMVAGSSATVTNSIVLGNASYASYGAEIKIGSSGTLSFQGKNIVGQSDSQEFGFDTSGFSNVINAEPSKVFLDFTNRQAGIDFGSPARNIANGILSGILADNGGRVETVALRPALSNPAIDAGDDSLSIATTDSRGTGFTRIVDLLPFPNNGANSIDLGALEVQSTVPEPSSLHVTTAMDVIDSNDYETSLREALVFANSGDADGDGLAFDEITFATGVGEAFEAARTITMSLGEFLVTEPVSIDAEGSPANVTLDAGLTSRVMNFTATDGDLSLTNFRLTNGRAGGSNSGLNPAFHGGALRSISSGKITLTNSVVSNSGTNNGYGGGVYAAGHVTLAQTVIEYNATGLGISKSFTKGGGVFAGSVSVYESTVRDNVAYDSGGGIAAQTVQMQDSTIEGNTSTFGAGGGVYAYFSGIGSVTMTNTTIAKNSTLGLGGAGGGVFAKDVRAANSTFSGNTTDGAGSNGGAISAESSIELTNSILLGNLTKNSGSDEIISFGQTTFLGQNLVGTDSSAFNAAGIDNVDNANLFLTFASTEQITGTSTFRGRIESNGGPVQTIRLNPHQLNPAIDAGQDELALTSVDARGEERYYDFLGYRNEVDLGAYELNDGDATVDANSLIVTTTQTALPFDGETSLTEALAFSEIGDADGDGEVHDTVTFATSAGQAFENGGTIVLADGELRVTQDLTVSSLVPVTIDANQQSRVLRVSREGLEFDTTQPNLTLQNLTLANGKTTGGHIENAFVSLSPHSGGAIHFDSEGVLTLINSTIRDSSTEGDFAGGGGAFVAGTLHMMNSTITGNSTSGDQSFGGGLYVRNSAKIEDSTLSQNETFGALSHGGGIWSAFETRISGSTIYSNVTHGYSEAGGVAIGGGNRVGYGFVPESYTAHISNSTFVGNSANNGGGLYAFRDATISRSTFTGNSHRSSSSYAAGGVVGNGQVHLADSIVLGNADKEIRTLGSNLVSSGQNLVGIDSAAFDASAFPEIDNADPETVFEKVRETLIDLDADGYSETSTGVLGGVLANNGGVVKNVALNADPANPALDTTRSPISLFRFEGDATDSIGSNDGTLQGSLGADSSGNNGSSQAIEFAGLGVVTDGYVELATPLTIGSQSHTIEVWVSVPALTNGGLNVGERGGPILSNVGSGQNAAWEVDEEGEVRIYWTDGQLDANGELIELVDLRGTTDLRDGQWHHLTFVRDTTANQFSAYIDGIEEELTPHTNAGTDLTFVDTHRIGTDRIEPTEIPFHGIIDELAIYDVALTPEEIAGRAALRNQRISDGNNDSSPIMDIGAFELEDAILVDNLADVDDNDLTPGNLTLREAVRVANASAGLDRIAFDTSAIPFGSVITLSSQLGQLDVHESVIIDGPGADYLTISGDLSTRIFDVGSPTTAATFAIRDLTLDEGAVPRSPALTPPNHEVGGAIQLADSDDTLILDGVTISNSEANGGGAIYLAGAAYLIQNSSFVDNTSSFSGSAILTSGESNGLVINSTFSGNSSDSSAGTLLVQTVGTEFATMRVINSTIVGEDSLNPNNGAGLQTFSFDTSRAVIEVGNSIIADNSHANAVFGGGNAEVISLGNNISDDGTALFNASGDLPNTDPLLGTLDFHGGTTKAYRLPIGSPAVDAGNDLLALDENSDLVFADQRGLPFDRRVDGNRDDTVTVDIGAFEFHPEVVGRHIFYNDSFFDGNDETANAGDDGAIAPSRFALPVGEEHLGKDALLPGQTATFGNYSSYSRGINGIMIDVMGLADPSAIDAGDFQFHVGNSDDTCTWMPAPAPTSVTVREGEGAEGSDRITILWNDKDIEKEWLQIIVLANADTGLTEADVHYWGNAIGESGNSSADARVNLADVGGARTNQTGFSTTGITNPYDFNRDTRVNLADVGTARTNQSGFTPIKLITPTNSCNRGSFLLPDDPKGGFDPKGASESSYRRFDQSQSQQFVAVPPATSDAAWLLSSDPPTFDNQPPLGLGVTSQLASNQEVGVKSDRAGPNVELFSGEAQTSTDSTESESDSEPEIGLTEIDWELGVDEFFKSAFDSE